MAQIEEISAKKSGASVIVAGFLIEGRLTRAEMAYLEYLGFGLQLLDDLQVGSVKSTRLERLYSICILCRIIWQVYFCFYEKDVKEDMKNNHRTIFTQSIADGETLDAPTARLIQYLCSTPPYTNFSDDYHTVSNARNDMTLAHYIHVSMIMFGVVLVLEAASQLRQYYSRKFYRELSTRSPVTFKSLKRIHVEKRIWSLLRRQWF